MSETQPPLDAETERIAVTLLRHIEWQEESFSIVFLFADVGPAMWMADWLDERLRVSANPLHRLEPKERFAKSPESEVENLIATTPLPPGAMWLALHRYPADEAWNRARRTFLARLNERRFLLERDFKRPLVIVLPVSFKEDARNVAPDLWHIRAFSGELRAEAPLLTRNRPAQPSVQKTASPAQGLPAYAEFERAIKQKNTEAFFLPTAWRAVDELLGPGCPALAMEVAEFAEKLARQRSQALPENGSESGQAKGSLRDLSVSLNNVGKVAQAQRDWAQAEAAYRESLSLRRQLVERLGGTPEALRDLSVSLNNVGKVAKAQRDWAQAGAAYRESLSLRRQLVERLGGTPEALRDLSVSLNNVGNVAEAQGDWAQAEAVCRESLSLRRQLVERLGGTPEALRDLSVSLNNVGNVARAQGDWAQAEAAYQESLSLRRQLVERLGGTPEALRDLSVSLNNVGKVAEAQGDWAQAGAAYRESLSLSRQLVERLGGTPEALRDLSVSLDNVGKMARAQGDWAQAEAAYRESLSLSRQLVERLGGTPEALRDLSVSLNNVGKVAEAQGDWVQAEAAYRESLSLRRQLVERLGSTPEALDRPWHIALKSGLRPWSK